MKLLPDDPEVPAGNVYAFYQVFAGEHQQFNVGRGFAGGTLKQAIKYVYDSTQENYRGLCKVVYPRTDVVSVLVLTEPGEAIYDTKKPELYAGIEFAARCDRIMKLRNDLVNIRRVLQGKVVVPRRENRRRLTHKAGILERVGVDGAVSWSPKRRKRFKGCVVCGVALGPLLDMPATVWDVHGMDTIGWFNTVVLLIDGRKWVMPYHEVGFV